MNNDRARNKASVMVLHDLSQDSLILTLRNPHLRDHPGEVCFPGGRWQEGDKNFYATALRELEEELSINADRITLLKAMLPEHTLTGYIIYPWFASIQSLNPYKADSREVAQVFGLKMNEVIKATNYQEISVHRSGLEVKTYQFTASNYFVWGATARIMRQLLW